MNIESDSCIEKECERIATNNKILGIYTKCETHKETVKYNNELLIKLCSVINLKRDEIETKNKIKKIQAKTGPKITEITRDTILIFKCKHSNCENKVEKDFRSVYEEGRLYCDEHKNIYANEKRIKTYKNTHDGVCNAANDPKAIEKREETNLKKYGATTPFNSPVIQQKIKETNKINFGGINPSQNIEVQKKKKQNRLDNDDIKYNNTLLLDLLNKDKAKLGNKMIEIKDIDLNRNTNISFICECGIEKNKPFRTIEKYGSRCSSCQGKNKTEKKICDMLIDSFEVIQGYYREWCKNKKKLPFDICVEELKIIVECDGPHHFQKVGYCPTPPEEIRKRDIYKMKCANDNGFSVIRIVQEDVWDDNYDWQEELLENINKIKKEGIVQNIFMCKNNEYKEHIKL